MVGGDVTMLWCYLFFFGLVPVFSCSSCSFFHSWFRDGLVLLVFDLVSVFCYCCRFGPGYILDGWFGRFVVGHGFPYFVSVEGSIVTM